MAADGLLAVLGLQTLAARPRPAVSLSGSATPWFRVVALESLDFGARCLSTSWPGCLSAVVWEMVLLSVRGHPGACSLDQCRAPLDSESVEVMALPSGIKGPRPVSRTHS